MTPERWQQINRVFQDVLDRPAPGREAFLNEICADDHALRAEILSLVSFHARAETFLEVPALEAAATRRAEESAESLVGTLIGTYKIHARLGTGGMGDVYLAEDTTLDRKVAIKFLPKALEDNALARRRQLTEAKAAAGLEHPNICGIYEVAQDADHSFIVMQYVEGETLAAMIGRRALRLGESIDVAIQVAEALALAHSRGVVHRDIKPQNIMITPQGQVKVLDFGLAKTLAPGPARAAPEIVTADLRTQPGLVVGTAPYMSPEQAKGDAIDGRSDLFSLGALLYECVTGQPAFAGNSVLETCAQVIHVDPLRPSAVNHDVPLALDRVILKALAKAPGARYQSAGDLRDELAAVRDSLDAADSGCERPAVASPSSRVRSWSSLVAIVRRPLAAVPLVLVVLAASSVPLWRRAPPYRPTPEAVQWYQRGTSALRDGAYYKASRALEQAIASDDTFALAHARLAEAWSELDYADKASREILRARSLVNDVSPLPALDTLRVQAITHVVLREFGSAADAYRRIAEQVPASEKAQALVDLGRAQEQNDDLADAHDSYQRASALATQDAVAYLRLAILSGRQQDLAGALPAFDTAERLYRALSNSEGEAEVFFQRGFLFVNMKRLRDARKQLDQALALASTPANPYQQIRTLLALSSVSAAEGDPFHAEEQAAHAIELARDNGIENQATSGLTWLGNVFLNRGDYAAAEKQYTQALELARRDNGRLNEAVASISLGSLRSQQRRTVEALRYLEPTLPFLRQKGYRKWLSQAMTLLARVHRDRGEYEAALLALREQLAAGEQVGDLSQVALARAEIGSVLARQEHYGEALSQFDASHAISTSLHDTVSVGWVLMERAGVQWQMGQFEAARRALDDAAAIAGPAGAYKQLLAEIRLTEARLELGDGHAATARMKGHQALDLAGDEYTDTGARATLTLGLAETRSGGTRAGTRLCAEAVTLATSTGDPQMIASALLALAESLLGNDEPTRALDAAERALESFVKFGQFDSEWRARLIASQSQRRLGNTAGAHDAASTAAARLASLEQRFGSEPYDRFMTRPDVQRFRKQLDQQLHEPRNP